MRYKKLLKTSNFLILMAGLLLQLYVVFCLLYEFNFNKVLYLHLISSLCLIVHFLLRVKLYEERSFSPVRFYSLLLTVFFPVIGFITSSFLLFWVLFVGKKVKSNLFHQYQDYIEDKTSDLLGFKMDSNIMQKIREEVGFESFVDIIHGEDESIKEKAIYKMSKHFSKTHVEILKQALNDISATVRLNAANALLKLEGIINEKILIATKMTKQRASARDYVVLGDLYNDYAESGLVDKNNYKYYMQLSSEAYEKSLEMEPSQLDVLIKFIESLMSLNDFPAAKKFVEKGMVDFNNNFDLIVLKSEICFNLRDFSSVEESLKRIPEGIQINEKCDILTGFWTK